MKENKFILWWKVCSIGIVVLGIGWMLFELIRVSWRITEDSGIGSVFIDGIVLHKIGELLVAAPFVVGLFLPMFWNKDGEEMERILNTVRILMLVGGVLNGIAWLSLRYIVDWHPWCLVIFCWGLIGFIFIKPLSLGMLRKYRQV